MRSRVLVASMFLFSTGAIAAEADLGEADLPALAAAIGDGTFGGTYPGQTILVHGYLRSSVTHVGSPFAILMGSDAGDLGDGDAWAGVSAGNIGFLCKDTPDQDDATAAIERSTNIDSYSAGYTPYGTISGRISRHEEWSPPNFLDQSE